jgi:nucleoside-diphosphate-sugar epimerase
VANYAFLDDVVAGHIAAMCKGIPGERYILGGHDISFNDFFKTLHDVSGKQLNMIRIPLKLIQFYSQLEWLKTRITGIPPIFLPEFADRLKYDQKYSSNKAVIQLGYNITPFAEGLAKTVNHLKGSKSKENENNKSLLNDNLNNHQSAQLCN